MVPRLPAPVAGYWFDKTNEVCPLPASASGVPELMIAPVSLSRSSITLMLADWVEIFSTATPKTTPPVLSKASR